MRLLIYCLMLTALSFHAAAQQVLVETGKLTSQFRYHNSQQQRMTNIRPGTQSYVNGSFRLRLHPAHRFYLLGGVSFHAYAATVSLDSFNTRLSWDTHFTGLHGGFDIELFKNRNLVEHRRGLTLYLRTLGSAEFMLYGTQTINQKSYNLLGVEQFNKTFYFLRSGLGINYCIAKDLAGYIQYMGGMSLTRSTADGEQLRIITHQIGLGLIISLGKCDYCYSLHY